jgi:hypothetical protein
MISATVIRPFMRRDSRSIQRRISRRIASAQIHCEWQSVHGIKASVRRPLSKLSTAKGTLAMILCHIYLSSLRLSLLPMCYTCSERPLALATYALLDSTNASLWFHTHDRMIEPWKVGSVFATSRFLSTRLIAWEWKRSCLLRHRPPHGDRLFVQPQDGGNS